MTTVQPRPDVTEMAAVHQVFRDTLGAAPQLVLGANDDVRTIIVRNLYENVLAFLDVHHKSEDVLVFPLLRERAPDKLELVERINAQHHDVEHHIAVSSKALANWATGDAAAQTEVTADLSALHARLVEHLDEEEREIVPLCAEYLRIEEWGALAGHAMMNFTGDKIWLILGLIRERMTQAQRDNMTAHMPPPALDMWTGFGERAFNDLMVQIGPPLR